MLEVVPVARHRPVAGDSPAAERIKVLARSHQRLIWERNRTVLRLRSLLREYFSAALEVFPDLAASDALELLDRAPGPQRAARLTRAQITAALKKAHRHQVPRKAGRIIAVLRAPQLSQSGELPAAYAAAVVALTKVIATFSEQITVKEQRRPQVRSADLIVGADGCGPACAGRAFRG